MNHRPILRTAVAALLSIAFCTLPATAQETGFAALFAQAEAFHESIGTARSQAAQAAFERDKVFSSLLPDVDVSFGDSRRGSAKFSVGGNIIRTREIRTTTLSVRQPLYTGGRASNQLRIATVAQAAGNIGVHVSREALIFDLASAYFTVLKAEADLTTVTERLTGMRQQAEAAHARVRLGADVRASALRMDSSVAALEAQQVAAEQALDTSREALALLTGGEPQTHLGAPPDLSAVAELSDPVPTALVSRTDLHLLEGEVKAARFAINFAKGAFLPFVDLTGTYQKQTQDPSLAFVPDEDASLLLNVTWNLYNGGEDKAEGSRARAVYTEKRLAYDRSKREIKIQVKQALRQVRTASRQTDAFVRAMESATENHRIVSETYRAGAATYLDVIDASDALGEARRNLVNARHDHSLALLALARATGQLVTLVGETVPEFTDAKHWLKP